MAEWIRIWTKNHIDSWGWLMAQFTDIDICNQALLLLGQPSITTLETDDDDSKAVEYCARAYESCRVSLLSQVNWKFALEHAELVEDTAVSALIPDDIWDYAFDLPTDFLRLVETSVKEYEISGGYFYCNQDDDVFILYVADVDEGQMPVTFTSALSALIARDICFALTGDPKLLELLNGVYTQRLHVAKAHDNQHLFMVDEDDSWISARR